MITESDSYNKILKIYDDLPRQQKKIADCIISRYDEVIFLSISKLATSLEVSEATIVRFAQNLGHKGFPELKEDLVNYYKEYFTPGERMRRSIEELPNDPLVFASHVQHELSLLNESIHSLDNDRFVQAIDAIVEAKRIFLFGNGGNACLADHLSFKLSRFKLQTQHYSVSGKNLIDKLYHVKKDDLVIAYHFYKPSIDFRRLMDICESKGIPVILITDSLVPPMIRQAKIVLFTPRGAAGTFHSQIVPMALNGALINGVASRLGDNAVEALQELSVLRDKHYYSELS